MHQTQISQSTSTDNLASLEQAERIAIRSLSTKGDKNTDSQRADVLSKVHAVIVKRLELGLATDD